MHSETVRKLGKVQYVKGSLSTLARIAAEEPLEMLEYLLQMAYEEAVKVEAHLENRHN